MKAMIRTKLTQCKRLVEPRGAALIAVMLLTMILSAVGLVAMQNTFNSLRLTGAYRMHKQAVETSDSVRDFATVRAGSNVEYYIDCLKTDRNLRGNAAGDIEDGGSCVRTREDYITGGSLNSGTSTSESGLFNGTTATQLSADSNPGMGEVDFALILRDPLQGPPPLGSDGRLFCTKSVYLGARATYSNLEVDAGGAQAAKNWERPPRAAAGLVGQDSILGSYACNGGGSR